VKDTREKILETTFKLLIKKGYEGVSVSDIQKEMGISRGLLYCYFKNKSDLILASCTQYFFDGYLNSIDLENISFKDFIIHVLKVEEELAYCGKSKIDILKYNTLYSTVIMREPRFKKYALSEFAKAIIVIRNAKKRKEIRDDIPDNFIGATLLSILGRTTYITATPTDAYVRQRIVEDIMRFYDLIKK
jgi:AcrR family transcriptional regulator